MSVPDEKSSRLGSYISTTTETVKAFVPPPLPPNPSLDLGGLYQQLDRANQALGRLDGLTTLLPDTRLFLYLYVRKEALLSSQIEGTKSSFSDLLLFENEGTPGVPVDDVEEVSYYVAAMQHGLRRIKGGFPLSLRLIREIHAILLRGGRGANKTQGAQSTPLKPGNMIRVCRLLSSLAKQWKKYFSTKKANHQRQLV
jgi:Fic family protein